MRISAKVSSRPGQHEVSVSTNEVTRRLAIAAKATGPGSSVNGGELLFLALATCYCNDVYREANKRGVTVEAVDVEVTGEFGAEGEPARNITYRAQLTGPDAAALQALARHTDAVAEIQNTLRTAPGVSLAGVEIFPSGHAL